MAEWSTANKPATNNEQAFVVDNTEAGNMSILSNAAGSPNPSSEPTMVEEAVSPLITGQEDQVRSIATRACLSCRRLKMKCVGAVDPPCERCAKAGRKCEFLQPGQTAPAQPRRRPKVALQQNPASSSPLQGSHAGDQTQAGQLAAFKRGPISSSYNTPAWTPVSPEPSAHGAAKKASELPSVYAASPLATIGDGSRPLSSNNNAVDNQQPPLKRRRTGGHSSEPRESPPKDISERDMDQLLELFQERILGFISILGPGDFDDVQTMLRERKALVQCVCYVTARFVPGGSAIRDRLYRPVSELLLGTSDAQRSTPTQSLALLQALIVLYAYAQAVPSTIEGSQSASRDLLYWRIKTFTEAHAIQLFLHRSIEGLRAAVAAQEPHISSSYCYKMYTYWLWLFTMSHCGSLATRTPPSIRADASIRAASKLLNEIGMTPRISRLLGEVELCLSWEQASIQETEFGEWWCQPELEKERDATDKDSLDEIQAVLNRWTHKWCVLIATGKQSSYQGSNLDFHIRFTKFCITTYSIRPIKLHATGSDGLSPAQKDAIANCVESASQLLAWALDLGPVSKDRLRYLGDFGFVILSFCAFFILQAFQAFGTAIPQSDDYLDTVEDAAQLMTELAMDSKHAPAVYGKSILLLLAKVRNSSSIQLDHHGNASQESAVSNRSRNGTLLDTQGLVGHEPSVFVPEKTWDFTSLFPDMLWN